MVSAAGRIERIGCDDGKSCGFWCFIFHWGYRIVCSFNMLSGALHTVAIYL
jgi:hypothetical protein